MTKRERFLAFANFEKVDRVPRRAEYVDELRQKMTKLLGKDPDICFDMDDKNQGAGLRPPAGFKFPDYSAYHPGRVNGKDGFEIDSNGCGHLNHGFHHFTEYISPLRNAERFEELESYPLVKNKTWLDDELKKAAKEAHQKGHYATAPVGSMYENAWQVRGYEPFLMDLMTQRDWAHYLLNHFFENKLNIAVAAAKADYDLLDCGDDIANQNSMMFAPDLWREVMKPYWAKVFAAARAIKPDIEIFYHSDGNPMDVLEDLIDIGVTILNPVQPECMDPVAIRKRYGKRLAFDGCVGTQSTFPFGTPAQMRTKIRDYIEALDGMNGGLLLSPTHVLEPEVPPENVIAFFSACDEFSK